MKKWEEVISNLTGFFQECFYKEWDNSFKDCDSCQNIFPNHKLFFVGNRCKECKGNSFISMHTIKLFLHHIPKGLKYCKQCDSLLPENDEHFTRNGKGYYSLCKICRGFSGYGTHQIGINAKLNKHGKKQCKYCQEVKSIEHFPQVKKTQTTRAEYCKDCKPLFRKDDNQQRRREDKVYKKSLYDKKYYVANRDSLLEYKIQWDKTDNGRKINQILNQKRNARKAGLLSDFNVEQWEAAIRYFDESCAYCGKTDEQHPQEESMSFLHQEHVIPVNRGGVFSDFNIIPACRSCNSKKNIKSLEAFYLIEESFTLERYVRVIDYLLSVF